ncbi:thiamine pyrophosphate-binding protein [Microbacterium sp. LWS13-1.2]|uniref:Thiamine pyrophosphate-binding protein n=1 Tax=Microbacterium sp. LWS13-1.2 TaxID=3135264 RepID=A0AAU6SE35_9MICO
MTITQHLPNDADTSTSVTISGGEAVARMFAAFDAGPIFGMGGFQLLPFYDAARRLGLAHHLINDERTGIFAADAYAKASGRVGLVDATLGPGATNLVTGLVEAFNAGTPIVALVGDSHRQHSWKNMTQETRQLDILRPAVKDIIRIEMGSRIPELVRRAFAVATSGRPGPVVLDLPEDISHDMFEYELQEFSAPVENQRIPAFRSHPDAAQVTIAAELIATARTPIVLAGGGVHLSDATAAVTQFAHALNIPIAHTLTGKGALACIDPLSAGLFGRYDRIANTLIAESDLVIVVGCKLGEIATKRYSILDGKRLIHLDSTPEEFRRTTETEVVLWGDARAGVLDILAAIGSRAKGISDANAAYAAEVAKRMAQWRVDVSGRLDTNETPVAMGRLLTEINAILPEDGYLIADGGFAAHWGGLLFDTKRPGRSFIADRGFASIGYGLPGAIGVSLAAPGQAVVSITGDGGFNMALGDLETALRVNANFTVIIVNNAASGYIKALQHLVYGEGSYHASDLVEMDYAAIATSMGAHGIRVDDPADLAEALATAIATPGPSVLDVVVTRDPAKMLPGVDSRAVTIKKGDRIA